MSVVTKNMSIVRGDTKTYKLVFRNQAGDIVDITNYTVMFTLKSDSADDDDDALISKTMTVESGESGEATLTLSPSDTDIDGGIYVYDIQLVTASGSVHTPVTGTVTIQDDVTKRTS